MPGTRASWAVTTFARSSGFATRRMATKSHAPVTEYASATPSRSASAPPRSGSASRSARIRTTAWVTRRMFPRRRAAEPAGSCALRLLELPAAALDLRGGVVGILLGARECLLGGLSLALGGGGGLLGVAERGPSRLHALLGGLPALRLGLALGGGALALSGGVVGRFLLGFGSRLLWRCRGGGGAGSRGS